jgi:hypothetical protein
VWDAVTGDVIKILTGNDAPVRSVSVSGPIVSSNVISKNADDITVSNASLASGITINNNVISEKSTSEIVNKSDNSDADNNSSPSDLPPVPTGESTKPPPPGEQSIIDNESPIVSDDQSNQLSTGSPITSIKEGIFDDNAVNTTTVNHPPLLRSSSDSNIETNKTNKNLWNEIIEGTKLNKITSDNVKKNNLNTLAKQLLPRREQVSQDRKDKKGEAIVKAAQDKYKLDKLNEYSNKFSESKLNDENIDGIMESFNDDKTITNQDKKDFLSQILNNNKYSEDIIKKINDSILLIDAMIDQEPKIHNENQNESDNESDYDSDFGSDFGSDDKLEIGNYGSEGYNQFDNIRGGKTRRRRSIKKNKKNSKSKKQSKKMRKNKKTRK